MGKANVSRDIDMTASLSLAPEQLLKADDIEQLITAVAKAAEKDFKEHSANGGTGLSDVEVSIEFEGYKTTSFESVDIEAVRKMSETELEDIIGEAVVTISATDNGIEHEAYHSHDRYSPDEPAYVEGLDDADIKSEVIEYIKDAFDKFDVEVADYEVDEYSAPDWDDVMFKREESARESAAEMAYEDF